MKIDITVKDPYQAVIDEIIERTKVNGCATLNSKIVKIRTTVLGETNEYLGVDNFFYYWENDWYEGGEVELLGFIDVDDVEVKKIEWKEGTT